MSWQVRPNLPPSGMALVPISGSGRVLLIDRFTGWGRVYPTHHKARIAMLGLCGAAVTPHLVSISGCDLGVWVMARTPAQAVELAAACCGSTRPAIATVQAKDIGSRIEVAGFRQAYIWIKHEAQDRRAP